MEAVDDAGREQVDEQLPAWRQGDCVIGEHWFLFRTNAERPLTGDATVAATEGSDNAEGAVRGFAVLTQTCDLVRHCGDRPFVEVSPLVEVDDRILHEIRRGRRAELRIHPGSGPPKPRGRPRQGHDRREDGCGSLGASRGMQNRR